MSKQATYQKAALLALLSETQIHAGAGRSVGVVDLPVQREAHTGWPCVFGSGVKGALRTLAEDWGMADLDEIFGPAAGSRDVSEYGGCFSVGDACLVLLPVRSLTTHFKWVTCPAVLKRLARQAARAGIPGPARLDPMKIPAPALDGALVPDNPKNPALFLEEFRFTQRKADLDVIVASLAALMPHHPDAAAALKKQLAIVDDDRFSVIASITLPVNAHVKLDSKTKTVVGGALWYEETLPPDTLLCCETVAFRSRKNPATVGADTVMKRVREGLFGGESPYVQVGGNETVGMGWCAATLIEGSGAGGGNP